MAHHKKDYQPEDIRFPDQAIVTSELVHEMKTSYMEYAMSVIVGRALPDVRDGLKPVHHKGRNRHHYEYWTDIDPKTKVYRAVPMPRKFFVEMVMDRIAACKIYHGSAYTDADALNYLVHAEEVRDGSMMHPDTRRELLYVLTMLRDRGEKETFRFLREVVLAGKPFAVPAQ